MITILFSPIGDLRSSFLAFHLNVIVSLLDAVCGGISAKIVISRALQQSQITQAEVITQYKNVIEKYLLTWALGDTNFWLTITELSKSSFRHGESDFFPLSLTRHEAKRYLSCLFPMFLEKSAWSLWKHTAIDRDLHLLPNSWATT